MNTQQQTLLKRFPVFTGLALFICFVLFPLFLIDAAVNRILQIQHDKSLGATRRQLDNALNTLEEFGSDSRFAHLLLDDAFKKSIRSQSPQTALSRRLQHLKRRHPGMFFFVAWDEKGRIIEEITDETAFAYMLRETFKLLQDLAENCRLHYPGAPAKIPGLDRRLKMVRHYIGRVVAKDWLTRPLQSERLASSIIAEAHGARHQLWYAVDRRLTLLSFIHKDFFTGSRGLEFAIKRLQAVNPAIKAGYVRFPVDPATIFQHDSRSSPVEIALAVSRFESLYPDSLLHHNDKLFSYRYISPSIRAFCYSMASISLSVSERKKSMAAKATKWLIIIGFLAWVAAKKYQINHIPARIKLSALFLYAGGIPVLIIFIIGADYLQQKRKKLIYAGQSRGLEQLRRLDEGFEDFQNRSAGEISRQLNSRIDKDLPLAKQSGGIAKMRQELVKKFQPDSIMLFDAEGRNRISDEGNLPFPDPAAISQVSKDTLEFLNRPDNADYLLSAIARPVATDFGFRSQFILSFSLGSHDTYAFFGGTGRPEKYAFSGMFYMFWSKETLQKRYLEQIVRNDPRVHVYFPDSDNFLSGQGRPPRQFANLLYKASSLLVVRDDEIIEAGRTFIAAAMRGNRLHKSCMGISIPMSEIDDELHKLSRSFALLSAVFMFFCGGRIIMMRHRLLAPLQQFRNAIEAIGLRNFRYRSNLAGSNEFGKLSRALDHTLENLGELEVARIVQENILPGREYRQNRIDLLASMTQMSHIGGDYYDFFAVNSEVSGIFIGDVSGHGISSALGMAMARSVMIFENFKEPQQWHLMQTMNDIIYQMRDSGSRDYMSVLSLFINSLSGEFNLLNAGHCPPILVRKAAGTAKILPCSGLYFGFSEEFEAEPLTGRMEPGDFMVLYTDGWVESISRSDTAFGFERFEQALLNCCDNDLETFTRRMYATITEWEVEKSDDSTLLLIKFGELHDN